LAMMPSVVPCFNAGRGSTCMNIAYTTIAKLIPRARKKVNGAHTVALFWVKKSLLRSVDASSLLGNIRADADMKLRCERQGYRFPLAYTADERAAHADRFRGGRVASVCRIPDQGEHAVVILAGGATEIG